MPELKFYDITIDTFRPPTQADIDLMVAANARFGRLVTGLRKLLAENDESRLEDNKTVREASHA